MTKSLFRALVVIAGSALLALASVSASAASITFNDPSCAGFQITGSGGSFTLACAKLSCSISGVTNPKTSQDTSLTAACTSAGVIYTWSLVTGPFSDASCNAPSSPTAATTAIVKPTGIAPGQSRSCLYQVTGSAPGLSSQATATVTWSDGVTTAPVCTPAGITTPTPMTSAGGTIALNANCNPSAGVTYTWTRTAPTAGAPTNPATATPSDTLAANTGASGVTYTWQVVACTSPTTCDTKSVTVVVPAPGGGGGGTGGVSCSGFTKTVFIDLGWPDFSTLHTQDYGGFNGADALVIKVSVPAGAASPAFTAGSLNLAEYIGPTAARYAVLSTSSCDWTGTIGYLSTPPNTLPILFSGANTVNLGSIQVGRQDYPSQIKLMPGTSYYLNVKNTGTDGVTSTCSGGCNMIITWSKPPGT